MTELVDLEVLLLRCRHERSKSHVKEAIACYHAGAHRAAVVSTWIAVVYDFIAKLDQLALAGDARASNLLQEFNEICREHNVVKSLKFERSMLTHAREDFELISEIEFQNLTRLMEDRHRCAHPSMLREGEAYDPGPETARYHIRNAIESLLQQEPAQGKYALQRVLADLDSGLFPETVGDVFIRLQGGPLRNPRRSLLRNYVVALLKMLLIEIPAPAQGLQALLKQQAEIPRRYRRIIHSLCAIHRMHSILVVEVFRADLAPLLERMDDGRICQFVNLLSDLRILLELMPKAQFHRVDAYVRKMPKGELKDALPPAWALGELRTAASARLESLDSSELEELKEHMRPEWLGYAIKAYKSCGSFDGANSIGRITFIPHAASLSRDQAAEIIACVANSDVRRSFAFPDVLRALAAASTIGVEFVHDCIKKSEYASLFEAGISGVEPERDKPGEDS
jgi:hypothetical protein